MTRLGAGLLCVSLLVSSLAVASETALSHFRQSPSLLPASNSDSPYLMAFNGELFANDSDRLLPGLLRLAEAGRDQAAAFNSQLLFLPDDVQPLIDELKRVDGRNATVRSYVGVASTLPLLGSNAYISVGLQTRAAATFRYDPRDEQALRLAPITGVLSGVPLHSRVLSDGIIAGELAVHRNSPLPWLENTSFGYSVKFQQIVLYQRSMDIVEYDESKLFDLGRDTREYSYGNIDIGMSHQWRNVQSTLVVHNLLPRDFRGPIGGKYRMRPQVRIISEADLRHFSIRADAHITPEPGFALIPDRREFGLSLEREVLTSLDLLLGYRHVDNKIDNSFWTAGFNYHLLDNFHLAAGFDFADRRQLGGNLRLQLFF